MILVFLLAPVRICAAAPTFDHLYVFGDSYSDVGNVFLATGKTQPAFPYFNGRFSNGPIWVDHIAGYLGLPLEPSISGGTDYAVGGAFVTAPQITPQGIIPSVPQQVLLYLSQHGGKADPNALYVLEGGGNDIANTSTGSPDVLGFQIAQGLAGSELLLRQAGARHFLIPNLFNVGLLPIAADHVAFATAASAAANAWLNKLLFFETLLPTVRIFRVDINSLMNAVMKDSTHFNFINVTTPCLTNTICLDPDHTLFWDTFHPTAFMHSFFAVATENTLAIEDR
jgi:outer membrane lipase/esterase